MNKNRKTWKMIFPKELSEEEKQLQIKYGILRRSKLKLKAFRNVIHQGSLDNSRETSQIKLKKAAGKILKAKNWGVKKINYEKKKTCGFKRSIKQNEGKQVVQKKSILTEYAPERDHQPRSVIVRGQNLSHGFLLGSFKKFGEISKVSIGQDNKSAVVIFKKSENAHMASVVNRGASVKENPVVRVELVKKQNTSWVDIAMKETTKHDLTPADRSTVHVSYNGNLNVPDIRSIFGYVGIIEKVYISHLDLRTASLLKKQFAFVTFQYKDEAQRAVEEVNGRVYNGITLHVSPKRVIKDPPLQSEPIRVHDPRELITYDHMDI